MAEQPIKVSVIGAGVIGLTVAYRLMKESRRYDITIVAEHLPGDEAPDYTSPWAGANYLPMSFEGSSTQRWEKNTGPFLWHLADQVPTAGVHTIPVTLLNRHRDHEEANWAAGLHSTSPWFVECVRNFKPLDASALPQGYDSGNAFDSLCINVPLYLQWLLEQVKDLGVRFERQKLQHIRDAAGAHCNGRADVVVNCSGFGSYHLGGVEDKTIFPARGQICLVRNQAHGLLTTSGTDDDIGEIMYVQPRVGGHTVLGGTYQKHSWSTEVDEGQAERIMKRCVALCPELTGGQGIEALDVIRHTVGLRPVREDGPRVQAEDIESIYVIHCYGHGGYGYQCSYGCALEVEHLIQQKSF